MTTSHTIPVFAHNSTVKAWCMVTNHKPYPLDQLSTQNQFNECNFLDGYNLLFDAETQKNPITGVFPETYPLGYFTGALKFSFITPMDSPHYKVFVSAYGYGPGSAALGRYPQLAHALNSSAYPKTQNSFWVRLGWFANAIGNAPRPPGSGRSYDNQVCNFKLWASGITRLGVVVV